MFTLAKRTFLFLGFLIFSGSIACQHLPEPLETDYDPSTQFNLPKGSKARLGKGTIHGFEYTADGTRFAVFSSIGVWLYDAVTLQELSLFTRHTDYVYSGSISPDGTKVAAGFYRGTVCIWDTTTSELLYTLKEHKLMVTAITFSPDGTILATAGHDGHLHLWHATTGEHLKGST